MGAYIKLQLSYVVVAPNCCQPLSFVEDFTLTPVVFPEGLHDDCGGTDHCYVGKLADSLLRLWTLFALLPRCSGAPLELLAGDYHFLRKSLRCTTLCCAFPTEK